jgi:hypothetical protein
MTEGIIQKVFQLQRNDIQIEYNKFKNYPEIVCQLQYCLSIIKKTEQELIAEIITLARQHHSCQIMIGNCAFVEDLIGDTE